MIGCSLPIIAKRLKLDPAVMSSPFVTPIVDAISLLIYFGSVSYTHLDVYKRPATAPA